MRVLVTGSSGQLGAEVCRQLSGTYSVTGLDAMPGPFTQVVGSVEECAWSASTSSLARKRSWAFPPRFDALEFLRQLSRSPRG